MDVRYSDEQQLLDHTAREIARDIGRFDGRPGSDPTRGWDALASAGLAGMRIPEEAGGAGAGAVEVAIVVAALASQPCRVPFLGPVLAAELLVAGGAEVSLLTEVAEGRRRYSPVLDAALQGLAVDGVLIDAAGADAGVGVAGEQVVEVGVGPPIAVADLTRVVARSDGLLAGSGPRTVTAEALARWRSLALTLLAADAVGVMEGALAEAVEHARSRVQFGRPIGSFQAVQHLCADALVQVEASRTLVWHAAWAVDRQGPAEALDAARTAKAYSSDAVRDVCEAVIQVLGGIGVTWESVAHLYLRRGLFDRQLLGDGRAQYRAIADRRVGAVR